MKNTLRPLLCPPIRKGFRVFALLLTLGCHSPQLLAVDTEKELPDPEIPSYPENTDTLPQGMAMIEISPFGYVGGSSEEGEQFNNPFMIQYGLTDNIELRVIDNGFSFTSGYRQYRGFEPPTFGALIHLIDQGDDFFEPSIAFESLFATDLLGNDATRGGFQPTLQFAVEHTLPMEISFNYTLAALRTRNEINQNTWEFQFSWAFQRPMFRDDLDLFIHGTYNTADLTAPYSPTSSPLYSTGESVAGGGFVWKYAPRFSIYGQLSGGLTSTTPSMISWGGFSWAF